MKRRSVGCGWNIDSDISAVEGIVGGVDYRKEGFDGKEVASEGDWLGIGLGRVAIRTGRSEGGWEQWRGVWEWWWVGVGEGLVSGIGRWMEWYKGDSSEVRENGEIRGK